MALCLAPPATSIAPHAIAPRRGYNFGEPLLPPRERLALFRASSPQWQFRETRKCPSAHEIREQTFAIQQNISIFVATFPVFSRQKPPLFAHPLRLSPGSPAPISESPALAVRCAPLRRHTSRRGAPPRVTCGKSPVLTVISPPPGKPLPPLSSQTSHP